MIAWFALALSLIVFVFVLSVVVMVARFWRHVAPQVQGVASMFGITTTPPATPTPCDHYPEDATAAALVAISTPNDVPVSVTCGRCGVLYDYRTPLEPEDRWPGE